MSKGGKRGRQRARDQKYTLGVDLGVEGGDYSAYVVSRRDPVSDAIEIVTARSFSAGGEAEARRIIREDLEAFGFRVIDAGGSES